MFDTSALTAVAAVLLLAGFVKGVVGFGLPTVVLALLTVAFGLPQAMALMLVPSFATNVWQAMHLLNGPLVHEKLTHQDARFRKMIAAEQTDDTILRQLYLAAYCRPPSGEELKHATDYLAAASDRATALEDICWAMLNTKEFLFQH